MTARALPQDESFPFPGRIVKTGDSGDVVEQIQHRLNEVGCGPIPEDGNFDKDKTERAVKLFQSRFPDVTGSPLKIDGQVGSVTWGALFGAETVPSNTDAPTALTKAVIEFARTQIGVREKPLGSNRGPEVDRYIQSVGLNPAGNPPGGFFWCVAFTFFCYQTAAKKLGIDNPHIKTAGVLDHWQNAGTKSDVVRIPKAKAVANPGLVKPGSLFIIDHGGGLGHSGLVTEVANGRLKTVEGNTNDNGSNNGIGVFERDRRKIADINKGFIDYSAF
jgi:peptidoglycan hydrolase-like protein with peptidoglycan-binding domain